MVWPSPSLLSSFFRPSSTADEHSREDEDKDEEEDEEYEGDIEKKSGYIEEISEDALFIDTLKRNPDKFHEMLSNMSSIDNAGITRMLGWAAGTGQAPDVISKIGAHCKDVSAWALNKCPALHAAIGNKHVLVVQELLRIGADVNGTSSHHVISSALHCAVYVPSLACVEALLEKSEIEVDATNGAGQTALHMCSICAYEERAGEEEKVFADIAAALMRRGANMNKEESLNGVDLRTPLFNAIDHNQCLILAQMLKGGEKPPAPVVASLMEFVKDEGEKYEKMLALLVEAGWGPYPLHDAVRSGNVSKLSELVSSGQDVNAVDAAGGTALHLAATLGNDDAVGALVRAKGILVDKLDKNKVTALYRAAEADKAGAVKALLDAKASRDVKDAKGRSVMHELARRPAGATIEALMAGGVSPGRGGEKGFTPLHTACNFDARGTVEALLRGKALPGHCWNDSLQSPLMVACKYGHLNAVQQLLPALSERQINMRSSYATGAETALVAAIKCLDVKMEIVSIVEALLAAKADPHMRTGPGNVTALANALWSTDGSAGSNFVASDPAVGPPLVRALVAAGAEVNDVSSPQGCTPFQIACFDGACPEVLQALLDAGADPCAPCAGAAFMSPLQLAALRGGDPRAVRLLIEQPNSGGLNAVGGPPNRFTALSAAVQTGQTGVVRYLLEEGADMDLLPFDDDGTQIEESLVEIAASRGHLDTMNLLIQATMLRDKAAEQLQQQHS